MSSPECPVCHLHVAAEPDPGALARFLERFQNLNIVLHIEVDASGLSEETVSLITSNLGQVPSILNAHWHR
jgi:hypothetical protein